METEAVVKRVVFSLCLATVTAGAVAVVIGPASASSTASKVATAASSTGWAQAGSNAASSNSNAGETVLTSATVSKLRYLRSYTSPPVTGCGGQAAPVIDGGDVTADINGYLVHFVAATGRVLWQKSFDDSLVTSVAVAGDKVIVGYRDCGPASQPDGQLAAYDVTSGKALWNTYTVPNGGSDGDLANIEVSDGYVITEGNSISPGAVTVHKVSDGSLVWADTTSTCNYGPAIVVDQEVTFTRCPATSNGTPGASEITARALKSGATTWKRAGTWTVERGDRSSATGANLLAVDPSATVADMDPATGATKNTLSGAGAVLAVDATSAFALCGDKDANGNQDNLCAYSLSTGKQVWSNDDTSLLYYSGTPGFSPAAAEAGGVIYLNTGDTGNAKTGKTITSATLGYSFATPPTALAVGDGRLLVADPAGRILDLYGLNGE
jgi:hypothetical protein